MADHNYSEHSLLLSLLTLVRRISAAIIAFATLRIGMELNGTPMSEAYQALLIIVTLLTLMIVRGNGAHTDHRQGGRLLSKTLSVGGAWLVVVGIMLFLGYATKSSSIFSRRLLLSWMMATPALIVLIQLALDHLIARITESTGPKKRAVIAGANSHGLELANKIRNRPTMGLSLEGIFDDRSVERLSGVDSGVLTGRLSDLPNYVRQHGIDLIYLALPMRNIQRVDELLEELHDTTASIYYVPDIFVFDLIQCRTDEIDGIPVVALCETPFYGSRGVVKRVSDFIIAAGALLALAPLMLLIAIAIKASTPGSVIFKQRRYGLDGREIVVYKFRTMYVSEDSDRVVQAQKDDRRITPVGAFLRKYSLDELPQFINVLQGHMSVVGPRPHAVAHNEEYRRLIKGYMMRHKVNPGVTGLAQVRGFRGETKSVEDMQHRVEADLEYLRNWSLGLDFRIILRTIAVMFKDSKAY
jgi:putative colanic acid biosynthesis UDP-glucose lipid carrier transferase